MLIAQISDPHLLQTDSGVYGGEEALRAAVVHLLALPLLPDVVLLTGDLADKGQPAEYARLLELLRPLPMPLYAIPGNHDDRAGVQAVFGAQGESALDGFVQYVVEGWPVRLIALDTLVPGSDAGGLKAVQLDWLDARLNEAPERPTLLFMHHPPFATGLKVFDEIGLREAEHFAAVVARHPQIGAVVAGHVHSSMIRRFAGTLALTCGSTKHSWLPDFGRPELLAVRPEPPGCLLHVWQPESGLVTHSSLIGQNAPLTLVNDGEQWL